jgi:predicted O-methyltransferase YrrM
MKINTYQDIQGWFDFENIYDFAVKNFNNCNFLEIGAWAGKSTAYMAQLIKSQNKNIKFYTVDTFLGEPTCQFHLDKVEQLGGTVFNEFWSNMSDLGLCSYVHPIISTSHNCIEKTRDKEFAFIFIDGAHDYDSVMRDLKYTYDHVLQNGLIGGHDYNSQCKLAVDTFFSEKGKKVNQYGASWLIQKM